MFEQYRLDLFLDHAWGRDRCRTGVAAFTGTWCGRELPRAVEHDAARRRRQQRAPAEYRDIGSMTLQILILKPLK